MSDQLPATCGPVTHNPFDLHKFLLGRRLVVRSPPSIPHQFLADDIGFPSDSSRGRQIFLQEITTFKTIVSTLLCPIPEGGHPFPCPSCLPHLTLFFYSLRADLPSLPSSIFLSSGTPSAPIRCFQDHKFQNILFDQHWGHHHSMRHPVFHGLNGPVARICALHHFSPLRSSGARACPGPSPVSSAFFDVFLHFFRPHVGRFPVASGLFPPSPFAFFPYAGSSLRVHCVQYATFSRSCPPFLGTSHVYSMFPSVPSFVFSLVKARQHFFPNVKPFNSGRSSISSWPLATNRKRLCSNFRYSARGTSFILSTSVAFPLLDLSVFS